jgi:acetyl-CoA acetyltransferase
MSICASGCFKSRKASARTSSPRWKATPAKTSTRSRSARSATRRRRSKSGALRSRSSRCAIRSPAPWSRSATSCRVPTARAHAAGPNGETLDQLALAAYPAAGTIRHVHTAGNSSGIVDGAGAVLVASERYVREHNLKPRARFRAITTVGSEPLLMLTGPAPASEKALRIAGMKASDIDLWEINEAFAAVVLQTIRAVGVDPDCVNVNGGAIALGHPLGATGAMLLGTALDELERQGLGTALITMCIGGGQGIATIVERV